MTTANVAETPRKDESPVALVVRLSRAKARATCLQQSPTVVSDASAGRIIVACDTIVALDGELLGKPRGASEAMAMLRRLRERVHTVYSAVTLRDGATGRTLTDVAKTRVTMRAYTEAEIAAYVATGDPFDKAGGYGIQHPGFQPVAGLQGCYANVVGLPLCHLTRCLRAWGAADLGHVPAACQARTDRHCAVYSGVLAGQPSDAPL